MHHLTKLQSNLYGIPLHKEKMPQFLIAPSYLRFPNMVSSRIVIVFRVKVKHKKYTMSI